MPLIEWTERLYVEIPKIDAQHKRLVQLINELYDAVNAHRAMEVVEATLDELVEYTKKHFALEEEYFAKFGYFDSEPHKREHERLAEQVAERVAAFRRAPSEDLGVDLLEFLKKWLNHHILVSDKKYAPFFKAKGVH